MNTGMSTGMKALGTNGGGAVDFASVTLLTIDEVAAGVIDYHLSAYDSDGDETVKAGTVPFAAVRPPDNSGIQANVGAGNNTPLVQAGGTDGIGGTFAIGVRVDGLSVIFTVAVTSSPTFSRGMLFYAVRPFTGHEVTRL